MSPTEYRRRVFDLLESYGVRDAVLVNGSNHPRVEFTYGERERKYTLTLANKPFGPTAFNMKHQDIRRLLGVCLIQRKEPTAMLSALTTKENLTVLSSPSSPPHSSAEHSQARPVGRVSVSCYRRQPSDLSVKIIFAEDPSDAFPASVDVSRVDASTWSLRPSSRPASRKKPAVRRDGRDWYVGFSGPELTAGLAPFAKCLAEAAWIDDVLVVAAPPPLDRRAPRERRKMGQTGRTGTTTPVFSEIPSTESGDRTEPLSVETRLRVCLAEIRAIERDTSWRLTRGIDWKFTSEIE